MNSTMRAAFQQGSGVDPLAMQITVLAVTVGAILLIALWITVQLIDAYRNEQLHTADVIGGVVKLFILVSLLLYVIV